MKLWLDTANIEEIREINAWGVLAGVTTNPSLAAKEGVPFEQLIKEIAAEAYRTLRPGGIYYPIDSYSGDQPKGTALAAIEWPDDQLSVFATLRGPFFGLGDEELLEFHHTFGGPFHPFRVPSPLPSLWPSRIQCLTRESH